MLPARGELRRHRTLPEARVNVEDEVATLRQLRARAEQLGVPLAGTKRELAERIAAAEKPADGA